MKNQKMQTTSHLLMIRPVNFDYNPQTAVNNAFQVAGRNTTAQEKALAEFNQFVALLWSEGVDVTVVEDTPEPHTPDSVFPNNWVSFHTDGTVVLYPMFAANRRLERKPAVLNSLSQKFDIRQVVDLSVYENENLFLEGTGSMVLDRQAKIAYACLSPRTDETVLADFCQRLGYQPVAFQAYGAGGGAIYHTNVMMCVGEEFVVIAADAITDVSERQHVLKVISDSGKEIVLISLQQMNEFAGNMLVVRNRQTEKLLVMSSRAYKSLTQQQVQTLSKWCRIVHSSLSTIETNGGGSARCMMAEIYLPEKKQMHSV
jgi:hypothetical protein